jgi:phage-related protein
LEVFKILGKIAIEGAEAAKDTLGGLGSAAAKTGKAIAAGLAAGAAAVGAVTKAAVDSYAEYEQLVGGVETLFKDSSDIVQDYAANAFTTAGLSANQYMETVTSFSASLLQSLDGDTAKAAEVADRAIRDMSDNANKMGTSMDMIQNAYQGFAKQNYTMLDNLKLGYGGTKEEMERLIQDAAKMTDVQKRLGITVDASSMSFANIANAISIVQAEMGIMGTTENEAMTTIQGSLSATKSAWQNLLTGFADEGANLGLLIENLVNSAVVAADNLVPRIAQILSGISDALSLIMPVIAAELPSILEQLLPGLIDGALALTIGLIQALPVIVEVLAAQLPKILMQLFDALAAAFPVFINSCLSLLHTIVAPIAEFLHGLITTIGEGISNGFKVAVNWVIDGINGFIRGINKIKIPDWVPGVGGKGFSIKEIPLLESGGVLEKGQTGFLEGNGAEAVVPLDQNRKWISAVAEDMNAAIGGDNERLQRIIELLEQLVDTLPETMIAAFASMKFDVNNREFARLVKAVG